MAYQATKHAIEVFRTLYVSERHFKPVVLGSLSGVRFTHSKVYDWTSRDSPDNVNFKFDEINSGDWNLVVNCCCEHMYPMSEVTLRGVYVMQMSTRYSDTHINRASSIQEFLDQLSLDEVYYWDSNIINNVQYYTVIGERI